MKFPLLSLTLLILFLCATTSAAATVYHNYYGSYGGDTWTSWEDDYVENNKSHATPPFAPKPSFGGCYISTDDGLLADLDCDKVVDVADNCLGIANPDQGDQNQNGLGDACDLVVKSIDINPPVVLEGRAFTVTVTLTNYKPYELRNLDLRLQVPELGLEQVEYVDRIDTGAEKSVEFFLRLPDCVVKKSYDVVLFVELPVSPGVKDYFYIPTRMGVASNGLCTDEPTDKGKSIINILDVQDVDPEKGAVFPFTIVNNEEEGQAYVLSVDGLEDWGFSQIEPRSLIVVPAGESRNGQLTVYANDGVTGEKTFLLTLRSKHDAHQELLTAKVKSGAPGASTRQFLLYALFTCAAILFILGATLLFKPRKPLQGVEGKASSKALGKA